MNELYMAQELNEKGAMTNVTIIHDESRSDIKISNIFNQHLIREYPVTSAHTAATGEKLSYN